MLCSMKPWVVTVLFTVPLIPLLSAEQARAQSRVTV